MSFLCVEVTMLKFSVFLNFVLLKGSYSCIEYNFAEANLIMNLTIHNI